MEHQKNPDVPSSTQELKTSTVDSTLHPDSESCSSAQSTPLVAPNRPRRLRSPRVEGSTEISQPDLPDYPELSQEKADSFVPNKASQPSGPVQQLYDDRPPAFSGHAAAARSHMSMRAASLPQAPSHKPPLTDLSVHPQRALSVAGTSDTKPHSDDDFRLSQVTSLL